MTAVSGPDLHAALASLLQDAQLRGGSLDATAFWGFVATLAHGRGITEGLHNDGLGALAAVPKIPKATLKARQARAYQIGLLRQLIMDIGGLPGHPSVLPANLKHGVMASDLTTMLDGSKGKGSGDPSLLTSARAGADPMRKHARMKLVGVVFWRSGRTGETRIAIWNNLWASVLGVSAEKTKLDRWIAEFGGAEGEYARAAFAAGQAWKTDDPPGPYASLAVDDADLVPTITLAASGQGKRAPQ